MFMASPCAAFIGQRCFLPRSGLPTLIRIKGKGLDFHHGRMVGLRPANKGPLCRKFNDEEAIFSAVANSPSEDVRSWYNWLR
jgi:hypothetical protein